MPNRSLRRYLVAIGTGFLSGQLIKHIVYKKPGSDGRKTSADDEQPKGYAHSVETKQKDRHPTEEEHRSAEQLYWRKSIATTWVAVVVATGAAVFSYKAFQETRRQADAADEGNRPWLAINNLSVSTISIKKEFILLNISVKNVGKTPARGMFSLTEIQFVSNDATYWPNMVQNFCMKARSINNVFEPENVVFPDRDGESFSIAITKVPKEQNVASAVVVGCVYYHDSVGMTHHSGLVYAIDLSDLVAVPALEDSGVRIFD